MFGNALGNCVYDKQHIKKFKGEQTVRRIPSRHFGALGRLPPVQDEHGFVLEPAKNPLMPQHATAPATNGHAAGVGHQPQPQAPPPPPAPAAAPQKSPTINYSPPQAGGCGPGRTAQAVHKPAPSMQYQQQQPQQRSRVAVTEVAVELVHDDWTGELPDQ